MNVSVQKLPNCQAILNVDIPSDVVVAERNNVLQLFAKQARIPGFRPGKAPKAVIEKRFGSALTEELDGRLMDKAVRETFQQEKDLKVIDIKRPDSLQHSTDGSARLTASLILAPDFTLPDYKGLNIEIPKHDVTDELIDGELLQHRQRHAEFSEITDRPAALGDIAVINYSSTLDGQPLLEQIEENAKQLAEGENYWVKVDAESFLPGFGDQLEGQAIGETREITVPIQEDFPLEELRGKDLVFTITLNELKAEQLPDDETLVEKLMPGSTIDDLKEAIKNQMNFQLARQKEQFKENTLLQQLTESVDFELPEEYLTSETQGQADRLVEQALSQGLSEDELAERQEEIFASAGERARNNLKTQFLLSEIAQAEKLQVTEPELVEHINRLANQAGKTPKAYAKQLQRERRIDGLRNQLLIGKTIDFLMEHANVSEIEALAPNEDESESNE
ncbi:MAG: trigger factor [Verrucomicrobiota bacterium]